ncbi:MAG: hypothetical protein NTY35_11180 [Planctomycetota bacterium]|nr:hypothetical protein [Planctomycetota bacterium]
MDLIEELIGLVLAFDGAGVQYAVCGGIALAIHGHPRFTKDIGILVRTEDLERALAAAATCGFLLERGKLTFRTGTPEERSVFRAFKARSANLVTLDLLLAGREHDDVWATRRTVDFEGQRVGVVSREGLVAMKRAAGRGQDLLDIEKLRIPDPGAERV